MRGSLGSRGGRAGVCALTLWVALAFVGAGSHVPGPGEAGLASLDGEHQPWHRHSIDDGAAARGPVLDHCVVCFVKGRSGTLIAVLHGVPRVDDSRDSLYLHSFDRGWLRLPPGLAPRAPPMS